MSTQPEQEFRKAFPSAKLVGPSGDGCHIEIDGKWIAYGNIPENAWKAAHRTLAEVTN